MFRHPPSISPNLVLVEVQLAVSGRENFQRLKEIFPKAKFALMDLEEGPSYENISRRLGADAFLSMARVPESLIHLRKIIAPGSGG